MSPRLHAANGKVFLAGAGPGDPELLTLKVHRLLRESNVILHDDLVSAEILALAGSQAMVHSVGKRCGVKKITQPDINVLMVESARRGLKVLRLKSGDPTIFGRLNEEIDALSAARIEFEVVPGITAGAAAAASLGVSMTDRRSSSRVVIVSGHHAHADGATEPYDWRSLARHDETLVVYMPGGALAKLSRELSAAGPAAATPCAIVSRVGTPHQETYWSTVGTLRLAPVLPPPTILVIGKSLENAAARMSASAKLQPDSEEYVRSLVRLIDFDVFDELLGNPAERRIAL
ncbi:MAG: uroporphyrinogen-III C-methyltransferase [Candidatus Acidiferrales bacterium]